MEFFRGNFKSLREHKGLTHEEIAKRLNISRQAVQSWESGETQPRPKKIPALADILGCSIIDISDLPPESSLNKSDNTIQNSVSLREIIKDRMLKTGLTTPEQLSRQIGYDSVNTIKRLLAGEINWFPDMLASIFDTLDIDPEETSLTSQEKTLLPPKGIFANGAILTRPVPIFSLVDASQGILYHNNDNSLVLNKWNPDTTETMPAPVANRHLIGFKAAGESMFPTIKDGDVVLCDRESSPRNNKIVVAKFKDCIAHNECTVIKRYRKIGDTVLLTSDNPSGSEYEVQEKDIEWIMPVYMKIDFDL